MNKKLFFILVVFFIQFLIYSQENQIIKSLRDKMLENINAVNSLKSKLLNINFDATEDLMNLKKNNLEKVFFYNDKKIMDNDVKIDEDINLSISLVHMNFMNLIAIGQQKIYISEFYLLKGKVYYFIGCKDNKRFLLLLFGLTNENELFSGYALINSRGELFFSKNINSDKIKTIVNKINDPKIDPAYFMQNKITKFKFFPNHEIYYFIEF